MSDQGSRWSRTEASRLTSNFGYSVAAVCEGDGSLGQVDHPVAVASAGATVIMLSISRSALDAEPDALIASAVRQLLSEATEGDSSGNAITSRIRVRLCQLFDAGAFRGAVPKGIALTVSDDGCTSFTRFGPVAVAAIDDGAVNLLHADDRFPALQRLGVPIEQLVPSHAAADPLLLAVSSLTQLSPCAQDSVAQAEVPRNGTIALLSRAVVPLVLPQPGAPLQAWITADAAWNHGMSGAVVEVFRWGQQPVPSIQSGYGDLASKTST